MPIEPSELHDLLTRTESHCLEFKRKYHRHQERDVNEIAKDIISLLNSAGRHASDYAHLVIGAGDKLSEKGAREFEAITPGEYDAHFFLSVVNARCTPDVQSIEYHEVDLNGRLYGVVP